VNRVPIHKDQTKNLAERPIERRRVPRIPFKATCVVTETVSSQTVVAQTTELSRFGCFVQTIKPHPKGTRVHIEMAQGGTTFVAPGVVAYVTDEGMGIVFSTVESENYEVLAKWLSRTPRSSDRYSFAATAQVKELGSWTEQVLITRDLSAGPPVARPAMAEWMASRNRVLLRKFEVHVSDFLREKEASHLGWNPNRHCRLWT
jgi:hypothetical protein